MTTNEPIPFDAPFDAPFDRVVLFSIFTALAAAFVIGLLISVPSDACRFVPAADNLPTSHSPIICDPATEE